MAAAEFRPAELKGQTSPWTGWEWAVIAALAVLTFVFRAYHLSAEGFADDEIHKWLAGNRYLHGDFGGDDVEHPMIMKGLIALAIAVFPKSFAPETLTRLPNVLAGAVTVWAVAQLGKRLFGKAAGLLGATIMALSPTLIGYGHIAKEDTLYTLFLMMFFWCLAEAVSAADDDRVEDEQRWNLGAAASIGGAFASKYMVFIVFLLPLFYVWLRLSGSKYRLTLPRFAKLVGGGLAVMLVFDWVLLLPPTWSYLKTYMAGNPNGDRATSESILFLGKLYDNLGLHITATPPLWFYFVFAAVKFTPVTVVLMAAGLGLALWQRKPAHVFVLFWLGFFFTVYLVMAVRYGRYFIPLAPAFALLAGYAAAQLAGKLRVVKPAVTMTALGLLVAVPEAVATVQHLPHSRLYLNMFAGGDSQIDYYFPHCDYFDAGLREAILAVAAKAEPNAEITAEPGWVVRYYADSVGRHDIKESMIRPESACLEGRTCYVIWQTGRLYWHNEPALKRLAERKPWTTIDVAGHQVIRVYRIEGTEKLFPSTATAQKP